MRICIVSLMNLKHSSLISLYTNFFEKYGIEYDLIYADKYGIYENNNASNVYKYRINIKDKDSFIIKLFKYYKFSKFVKNTIKKENYETIIIWRTETALLLFNYLLRVKNKKIIINIRDYCFDDKKIIRNIIGLLVKKSLFTTISSKGFYKFLPKHKYIFVNSIKTELLNAKFKKKSINLKTPINISFIGYVRFIEQDIKLINTFKGDDRFILTYAGEGSEKLLGYVKENKIDNVNIIRGFDKEETLNHVMNADIINNLYGNKNVALDTAISTRYYYTIGFNIPILVNEGTYMSELINEHQGFIVGNDYEKLPDKLFDWYTKIDFNKLEKSNEEKLSEIKEENKLFETLLKSTFVK